MSEVNQLMVKGYVNFETLLAIEDLRLLDRVVSFLFIFSAPIYRYCINKCVSFGTNSPHYDHLCYLLLNLASYLRSLIRYVLSLNSAMKARRAPISSNIPEIIVHVMCFMSRGLHLKITVAKTITLRISLNDPAACIHASQ